MFRVNPHRNEEGGQIIVLFALAMVAVIAMVGLVLDGGSAFGQRRAEQAAADLAALNGANTILVAGSETAATAAARATAAENGFTHGVDGTVVSVAYDYTDGAKVTVTISAQHQNNFVSIMGMPSWTISTTATAKSGIPDTVVGAGPLIFSVDAFENIGGQWLPKAEFADKDNPYPFGDTNNDAPETATDFAWTNYGTGNVNTNEVEDIIEGDLVISKTLDFGEYIGQHNNGFHTALFTDVDNHLSDTVIATPIVDHNGVFQGWAAFHVEFADKHNKKVYGYFESPFMMESMTVGCSLGDCPRFFGVWELKLVN